MSALVVVILQNFDSIHPITLSTTSHFLWLVLLSSIHQHFAYWLPSIPALTTRWSYGLMTKTSDSEVTCTMIVHSGRTCPELYLVAHTIPLFCFPWWRTFSITDRDHRTDQLRPIVFMITLSFILAFRCAPLMSVTAISLLSVVLAMHVRVNTSWNTVGDVICSFEHKPLWTVALSLYHFHPFSVLPTDLPYCASDHTQVYIPSSNHRRQPWHQEWSAPWLPHHFLCIIHVGWQRFSVHA